MPGDKGSEVMGTQAACELDSRLSLFWQIVHLYCDNGLYWPIYKFAYYVRNFLNGYSIFSLETPFAGWEYAG